MDEKMFRFWKKLSTGYKVVIMTLVIGIVLCVIGGIFWGVSAEVFPFNFRPLALVLCIIGGLIVFFSMISLLAISEP